MPTNRELFFYLQKEGLPNSVITFALQEINGFDRLLLAQNFDKEIKDFDAFKIAIRRYKSGEMIEYVFNKAYFLSFPFYVNKNVLIPRQETEQLVVMAIDKIRKKFSDKKLNIADVCTGSGAIGISMARKLTNHNFFLSDILEEAIHVANINLKRAELNNVVTWVGDMLEPFIKNKIKLDVIVCNPPYIEDITTIDQKTWKQEPHLSLLAKPETKYYEIILKNCKKVMNEDFLLCFEIGENMEKSLTEVLETSGKKIIYSFEKDIYGKTRFLFIENSLK